MAAQVDQSSLDDAAAALRRIDPTRLPRHVAIIMDGNGRWARGQGLPRSSGHFRGAQTVRDVVRTCRHLPTRLREAGVPGAEQANRIEYLTLYTFSKENWTRPEAEVGGLMQLIERQLHDHLAELNENGVAVRQLGPPDGLPASLRGELERDVAETAANRDLVLYLALNYGGRAELADAARRIAGEVAAGRLALDEIDEQCLSRYLYAPEVPDPELLIRTGGDMRISNFLIWQVAYAELWVTRTLWPDFGPAQIYQAIADYQGRERRFGGLVDDGNS